VPLAIGNILQPSGQFKEIATNTSDNYHNHINVNFSNQTENSTIDSEIDSLDSKLQKWVVDFHVTHNCVNALLTILRSEGLQLPKDTRTLLKTPKTGSHNIISIHPLIPKSLSPSEDRLLPIQQSRNRQPVYGDIIIHLCMR